MKSKLFSKISIIYNEDGIGEVFKRIFKKIAFFLFQTNSAIWHIKELGSNNFDITPTIPLIVEFDQFFETLKWIELQNVPWMLNDQEKQIAIDAGHYWPNIKYRGLKIGYLKIGFGNVFISDYKKVIRFPKNTAYIYDTFVSPEFRGKKVASYLIHEACNFLESKGFIRVLCHIPAWNIASLIAYSRVGFVKRKRIRWIKILGLQILTFNPAHL